MILIFIDCYYLTANKQNNIMWIYEHTFIWQQTYY